MNVVVFGPGMEERPLPSWALQAIEHGSLTVLEVLVQRVGQEIYGEDAITIVGAPWVNPRGRGRANASVIDYLNDPVRLCRALEVAFNAPRATYPADGAVVAADVHLQRQLTSVRDWVTLRLSPELPCDRIVWWTFDPDFEAILEAVKKEQTTEPLQDVVRCLPLPGTSSNLMAFCEALHSVFQ